jgi:hypothetical protein
MSDCCSVYDVGQSVSLVVDCYADADDDGVNELTDPDDLLVRVRTPAGVVAVYTLGIDANVARRPGEPVGKFRCRIVATEASTATADWEWRWEASGNVQAPKEGYFRVRPSRF